MNLILADGHSYGDAEATARRLEREELIERCAYEATPGGDFPACEYCDGIQGEAVLSWCWRRWDSTSNGGANCCCRWECCRAVLSEAELDADPEDILVEHPIYTPTAPPALAA